MRSFSTQSFDFIDFADMNEKTSKIVWQCRNLPEIRRWMVNQDPILWLNHSRFLEHRKNDSSNVHFCIMQVSEFVGSINYQVIDENTVERGIYINPKFWGKNIALKVCREFYEVLNHNMNVKLVCTKVFKDNIASNKLEISLGAGKVREDEQFNYYSLSLE